MQMLVTDGTAGQCPRAPLTRDCVEVFWISRAHIVYEWRIILHSTRTFKELTTAPGWLARSLGSLDQSGVFRCNHVTCVGT